MNEIATVTLRTGHEEVEPLVRVMMISLRSLMEEDAITFYELVCLARDPNHQPWGGTAEKLKDLNLMESNGTLHDSIRNITLAATEGEMLELRMRSPVEKTEESQ